MKLSLAKDEVSLLHIVILSAAAALFFSFTFVFNSLISSNGGHWYWSGTLRFLFTLLFLALIIIITKGLNYFKLVIKEFSDNYKLWLIAGSIGFGGFYALLCFAADYSPGWVIATTWQLTIIASLFVLLIFGQKLSKSVWFFSIFIFVGVTLVNLSHFDMNKIDELLLGTIPVLIAAFCYPFGNQIIWNKKKARLANGDNSVNILNNGFVKAFLLMLGSAPVWLVLFFIESPGLPSTSQIFNVIIISIFSGVIATSLFLYARNKANSPLKIMIVDASQSLEVIFTLVAEVIFLNALFPTYIALIGIIITFVSLFLLIKSK